MPTPETTSEKSAATSMPVSAEPTSTTTTSTSGNTSTKKFSTTTPMMASPPTPGPSRTAAMTRAEALGRVRPRDAPEGHLLGNFAKYYDFNPPAARLAELPVDFWRGVVARAGGSAATVRLLDIGCNDGTLTQQFREALLTRGGARRVEAIGVDIDAELIARGQRMFAANEVQLVADDVAAHDHEAAIVSTAATYDLVTCFGVTMWVHLNYGDEGLLRLLRRLAHCTRGSLVIEPQLWKSYKNAKRRLRRAGARIPESFLALRVGSQEELDAMVHGELSTLFPRCTKLGTTANWGRNVWEYSRDPDAQHVAKIGAPS